MWPLVAGLGVIAAALWSMKKSKEERESAKPKALLAPLLAQYAFVRVGPHGPEVVQPGESAPVRVVLLETVQGPGKTTTTREKVLAQATLPVTRLIFPPDDKIRPAGAVFKWEGEHVADLDTGDYFVAAATK